MGKVFNVSICGAGTIARGLHVPALEARPDRFRILGFYDIVPERAAALAGDRYTAYGSYEELLAEDELDLVLVSTKPLPSHYPCAEAALQAGKHLLLEKPMASTTEQCDRLIELARSNNVVFTVHHNRRLNIDFMALQHVLASGKIGTPRFIENRVPRNLYDHGDFVDWGVHLVDQCLLLNPSPLAEVSATFAKPEGALDDCGYGEATFRFEEGPMVRMAMMPRCTEFLRNGTPGDLRFYAAGTLGTFQQRVVEDPRDLINATQNFDSVSPDYAVPPFLEIRQKGYYDYLYDTLSDGAPLAVRPEQARNAIRVLELMKQSAQQNRTVAASGMLSS